MSWFCTAAATEPITQGDLIPDCLVYSIREPEGAGPDIIEPVAVGEQVDCIVLTQACDLDLTQNPVPFVTLAPVYTLNAYKIRWAQARAAAGKTTNDDAWRSFRDSVRKGFVVNLVLLNELQDANTVILPFQVVDFQPTYTLPRAFLQKWVANRAANRYRLLSPYREYVSQAYGRYFSRIGLYEDIPPFT